MALETLSALEIEYYTFANKEVQTKGQLWLVYFGCNQIQQNNLSIKTASKQQKSGNHESPTPTIGLEPEKRAREFSDSLVIVDCDQLSE